MSEFIYILENQSMPGMVKIGRTDRNAIERASELSSHSGVPTEFKIVKEYPVANAVAAERQIHEHLSAYRLSGNREFFRLSADEALEILDGIFSLSRATTSNFDVEDELLAAATKLAIMTGHVRPGIFAGVFKISYEKAERIIQDLKARGVLDDHNDLSRSWKHEHEKWLRAEKQRLKKEENRNRALMELHYDQIQVVKQLLSDLCDPETGEIPEIDFDREGDELVVQVRGSEWVKTEAQKRLAVAFPDGPIS